MKGSDLVLWVSGDPICDTYLVGSLNGSRFSIQEQTRIDGGALNVFNNAYAILRGCPVTTVWAPKTSRILELTRLTEHSKLLMEFWGTAGNREKAYSQCDPFYAMKGLVPTKKNALILSDYNKGMLNRYNAFQQTEACKFEFAVVDSRYRTFNTDLLVNCKTKIWHATGDEYDWDYAKHFDYVIKTDGPKPVWLGPVHNQDAWQCLDVPDTPVTDVTGSGDTFTAAIGAFLAASDDTSYAAIAEATSFAIDCCQETIQEQYCAITTKLISLRD